MADPNTENRITLKKAWQHFNTITKHRHLVRRYCFRCGLYLQGLTHDLSKYSPTEFLKGARYYQGNQSPNNAERKDSGISLAWLHHKGRNKHHFEYWIDFSVKDKDKPLRIAPMPKKYICEMFVDRVVACKIYNKENFKLSDPLDYFNRGDTRQFLHPKTLKLIEFLLTMYAEKGEKYTFAFIRKKILKNA